MKKFLKRLKSDLKYKWQGLFWLHVLNSPFRRLTFSVYFGRIKHGTPYFYPRRLKKFTWQDCIEASEKAKNNPRLILATHDPEYYRKYNKFVPIKYFGVNLTGFGWKTKWDSFRFEWSPSISVVIFGKQLFIVLYPKAKDCINQYWEAFLYYHYRTDRRLSKKIRLTQLFEQHSCTWVSGTKAQGNKVRTDYYNIILKPEYVKFYHSVKD